MKTVKKLIKSSYENEMKFSEDHKQRLKNALDIRPKVNTSIRLLHRPLFYYSLASVLIIAIALISILGEPPAPISHPINVGYKITDVNDDIPIRVGISLDESIVSPTDPIKISFNYGHGIITDSQLPEFEFNSFYLKVFVNFYVSGIVADSMELYEKDLGTFIDDPSYKYEHLDDIIAYSKLIELDIDFKQFNYMQGEILIQIRISNGDLNEFRTTSIFFQIKNDKIMFSENSPFKWKKKIWMEVKIWKKLC